MRFCAIIATIYALCASAWAQSYPTPQFNQFMPNFSLSSSVTSHELTVSLLDPNGNALGASHPVIIDYPTSSSGANVFRDITASLSITTGATSDSFGCTTLVLCRLWVWSIDNSGTEGICLYNADSSTGIVDLNEAVAQTSASGTGGGASGQTLYCNISSVTSKPVRRLGYIEAIWTSGTGWASASVVQTFHAGIKKPGDVLQVGSGTYSSSSTLSGTSYAASSITFSPTLASAANFVRMRADVNVTCASTVFNGQWSRGSSPTLIGENTTSNYGGTPLQYGTNSIFALDSSPGSTTPTYTVYVKETVNADCTLNSQTGSISGWQWEEIMGALEPTNDNINPAKTTVRIG